MHDFIETFFDLFFSFGIDLIVIGITVCTVFTLIRFLKMKFDKKIEKEDDNDETGL